VLYIPLEIVNRDPIGPVASVNNTASLTLKFSLNPRSPYSPRQRAHSPFASAATRISNWEPKRADKQGRPISPGTARVRNNSVLDQGSVAIAGAGTINQQLITGLGYPFREYAFLYRDNTGARAGGETGWPDPLIGLKFEGKHAAVQLPENVVGSNDLQTIRIQRWPLTRAVQACQSARKTACICSTGMTTFSCQSPVVKHAVPTSSPAPEANFIFNGAMGTAGTSIPSSTTSPPAEADKPLQHRSPHRRQLNRRPGARQQVGS